MAKNQYKIRVSLSGSLKNAARAIDEMLQLLEPRINEDELANLQAKYHAFCLREIAEHASGVASGKHSLEDFADHYCLTPREKTPDRGKA